MQEFCVIPTLFDEGLVCHKMQTKSFIKGERITSYIENRKQICFLKRGRAELIRTDFNGDVTTLEYYNQGDLFGEIFYFLVYLQYLWNYYNKMKYNFLNQNQILVYRGMKFHIVYME